MKQQKKNRRKEREQGIWLGGKRNKRGQAFMIGIMVAIMALLIFVSTLPAVKETINTVRGCSYMNCAGYVDPNAVGNGCSGSNQTYMATYEEDSLGCTILDLAIPFLVLGVLVAIIYKIMRGESVEQMPQGYGGY